MMARRTGNNYSGPRWLHSTGDAKSAVPRRTGQGVSIMGGSGIPTTVHHDDAPEPTLPPTALDRDLASRLRAAGIAQRKTTAKRDKLNRTTDVGDRHITHVEHDHAGWYFWCEADDCYAPRGEYRYYTTAEAYTAAAEHQANPG